MNLLLELKAIKNEIAKLSLNQRPPIVDEAAAVKTSSGYYVKEPDVFEQIENVTNGIEELYQQLISAQSKLIKLYESNY